MSRVVCVLALLACSCRVKSVTIRQASSPEHGTVTVYGAKRVAVDLGRCTEGGSVAIVGAVKLPGRYACTPGMKLASLVGAAGGLEHALEPNAIEVRHGEVVYRISYDGTIDEKDLPEIALANDDLVQIDVPGE